jgi:hypothetical protein
MPEHCGDRGQQHHHRTRLPERLAFDHESGEEHGNGKQNYFNRNVRRHRSGKGYSRAIFRLRSDRIRNSEIRSHQAFRESRQTARQQYARG